VRQTTSVEAGVSGSRVRQARLKTEYSLLYPNIEAGIWAPAASLADRLLADWLLHGGDAALMGRHLIDAHFEFRGGSSQGGERAGIRNRMETIV
jgi:hypothetical protein